MISRAPLLKQQAVSKGHIQIKLKGAPEKAVAKKMGVTQAALSQMESGKRKLRKTT